jgi:hypothetical protein
MLRLFVPRQQHSPTPITRTALSQWTLAHNSLAVFAYVEVTEAAQEIRFC